VVVAAVIVAVASSSRRRRTEHLKERFGPEYERVVSDAGEQKAAEKELLAREHQRKQFDIVPLTPAALRDFSDRWRTVQAAFVDNPTDAVGSADRLVSEVMRQRGYPIDDFEQQAANISVDRPHVVEHYRAADRVHLSTGNAGVGTEQQRQAFVHYRALFAELLEAEHNNDTSQEATA
jgi:hypothetical protein